MKQNEKCLFKDFFDKDNPFTILRLSGLSNGLDENDDVRFYDWSLLNLILNNGYATPSMTSLILRHLPECMKDESTGFILLESDIKEIIGDDAIAYAKVKAKEIMAYIEDVAYIDKISIKDGHEIWLAGFDKDKIIGMVTDCDNAIIKMLGW
jgi:hypothetical protein